MVSLSFPVARYEAKCPFLWTICVKIIPIYNLPGHFFNKSPLTPKDLFLARGVHMGGGPAFFYLSSYQYCYENDFFVYF